MMNDTKYFHSTNWAPWLGFAFLLSGFFFSVISNNVILFGLVVLSFCPALAVWLLLQRYSIFRNGQRISDYYQRITGDVKIDSIDLHKIVTARWRGKSVILTDVDGIVKAQRLKNCEAFVNKLRELNPDISIITY